MRVSYYFLIWKSHQTSTFRLLVKSLHNLTVVSTSYHLENIYESNTNIAVVSCAWSTRDFQALHVVLVQHALSVEFTWPTWRLASPSSRARLLSSKTRVWTSCWVLICCADIRYGDRIHIQTTFYEIIASKFYYGAIFSSYMLIVLLYSALLIWSKECWRSVKRQCRSCLKKIFQRVCATKNSPTRPCKTCQRQTPISRTTTTILRDLALLLLPSLNPPFKNWSTWDSLASDALKL